MPLANSTSLMNCEGVHTHNTHLPHTHTHTHTHTLVFGYHRRGSCTLLHTYSLTCRLSRMGTNDARKSWKQSQIRFMYLQIVYKQLYQKNTLFSLYKQNRLICDTTVLFVVGCCNMYCMTRY